MNFKTILTKKTFILMGVMLCVVMGFGCWFIGNTRVRNTVKDNLCAEQSELCRCFKNIVDYRFTDKQAQTLLLIQDEIKTKQEVNALEFASLEEIQSIRAILSVCQPQQVIQQPVAQPSADKSAQSPKSSGKTQGKK